MTAPKFRKGRVTVRVFPYMTYRGDLPKDLEVDAWLYRDFAIHRPVSYETEAPMWDKSWNVSHIPTGMSLNGLFIPKDDWRASLGLLKERIGRAIRLTVWEHLSGKPYGWVAGEDDREMLRPLLDNRAYIMNGGEPVS